jgi:hypothetical protein
LVNLEGSLSVFLGNGDGTFQTALSYSTGNSYYPATVAIGDFNGDGRADVAILGTGSLGVLLGNGDGSFQGPVFSTSFASSNGPYGSAMVELDLNGDGKTDLAFANQNGMLVLLGNGDGTFQQGTYYVSQDNNQSYGIATGDFNGDGKPDLAVTSYGSSNGFANIFVGNGDGTFQTAVGYGVGPVPYGVVVADFNGDGRADVATVNNGGNSVSILLATNKCMSLSPSSIAVDSTGNSPQTVTVTAPSSCSWSASTSSGSWIQLSPSSGTGNGTVTVTIAANSTGADRSGQININGAAVTVSQDFTAQVFADVLPAAFYFDAVNLLSTHSITSGCSATPFDYCPNENIIRSQMAVFIVRAVYNGSDNFPYSTTPYFSDVGPTSFGFKWIQRMYELGITTGCGGGMYCPNETVTRGQMAAFLIRMRYGSYTAVTWPATPYFTDVPATAQFFTFIQRMKEDNITSGCTATTYCPNNPVTRGEMAIFVMRGAFNQLLPSTQAIIASVSPAALTAGTSGTFTVTGVNTNFVQGATDIVSVDNNAVTSSNLVVTSPTTLTVTLTATAGASQQPVSIYVQTGTQEAVLPNGLTVE